MATGNVPLPDPMKDWVQAQARNGRYRIARDDGRDLIRRDQERLGAVAKLQAHTNQGLDSGIGTPTEGVIRPLSWKRAGA